MGWRSRKELSREAAAKWVPKLPEKSKVRVVVVRRKRIKKTKEEKSDES